MDKINYELDLAPLFKTVGITKSGKVNITENTYEFDPKLPKNYWLHVAFLGFQNYAKHNKIKSFATVGTGGGIDAIGAYEIFKPKKIIATDVHPEIPALAKKNIQNNIPNNIELTVMQGDLCQPLIKQKMKVDVVYANLPNLPCDNLPKVRKANISYFEKRDIESVPKKFQRYNMTLQYLFLKEAKKVINKGGAVIDAIGGRIPYKIIKELFIVNGYKFSELASVYKLQTEPYFELKGYAEAEKKYCIEFDFYYYTEAQKHWLKIENKKFNGPKLKKELKKYRVNATEAYTAYLKDGSQFGRVSHILCGKI